jgi:hypothetical protein
MLQEVVKVRRFIEWLNDTAVIHCCDLNQAALLAASLVQLSFVLAYQNPLVRSAEIAFQQRQIFPAFEPINVLERHIKHNTDAGFAKILGLFYEAEQPLVMVDHKSQELLLINDRFERDRLIWEPEQYIGFNTAVLWQANPARLHELNQQLKQSGRAVGFEFTLNRVDGSKAEYVKDFYIAPDFLGRPARLSVSRSWQAA